MYCVTFILAPNHKLSSEPQTIHKPFGSVDEIRGWARSNNYVLGEPAAFRATFSVRHADGTPLTSDELFAIQPEDSEELFRDRQRIPGYPEKSFGLDEGLISVALRPYGEPV